MPPVAHVLVLGTHCLPVGKVPVCRTIKQGRLKDVTVSLLQETGVQKPALGSTTGSQRIWQLKRVWKAANSGGASRVAGPDGQTWSRSAPVGKSELRLGVGESQQPRNKEMLLQPGRRPHLPPPASASPSPGKREAPRSQARQSRHVGTPRADYTLRISQGASPPSNPRRSGSLLGLGPNLRRICDVNLNWKPPLPRPSDVNLRPKGGATR